MKRVFQQKASENDKIECHVTQYENGGFDCDIIHMAQVLLQNIDPNIDGFQRPVLGPVRNVKIITGEFIQILHIGKEHGYVPVTLDVYQGKLMYITACIIVLRRKSKNRF